MALNGGFKQILVKENQKKRKKKSMETATRALRHCVTFLRLAPKDIICLIPRRIGITLKQKI